MSKFYTSVIPYGDNILVRGYENGKRVQKKVKYEPYLFVPTKMPTKYKTLEGKPVDKIEFSSIKEARKFMLDYKDVDGMPIYGLNKFHYMYMYDTYQGDIDYDPALVSAVSIDIEVDISGNQGFPDIQKAENEITLITISRKGAKAVFGCGEYTPKSPDVKYYKCANEPSLLRKFLEVWNSVEFSPDVVTGWNIEFFDVPYTINRIWRVLGENEAKKISPWSILNESKVIIAGRENQVYYPGGLSILDYMQLYKKFAYTIQESYSLDYIAQQELGERKLDYGEYGSLANLQTGSIPVIDNPETLKGKQALLRAKLKEKLDR